MRTAVAIDTERFLLRELTLEDVSERYLGWLTDLQAQKYITAAATTRGIDDLRRYVAERVGRDDVLFLGIFESSSGMHIGNIKFEPLDSARGFTTMGILIGESSYRGKGVTPEVLIATAQWLKRRRNIRQILLGVARDNEAAIRAYEKVGFVIEDTPYLSKFDPDSLAMVWRI